MLMRLLRDASCVSVRAMKIAAALIFVCGIILGVDVGMEIHNALLDPTTLTPMVWFHLLFELAASVGLAGAFALTLRELRTAIRACAAESHHLHELRNDFDALLQRRFEKWGLSQAEHDVALLTVRGLKIAEIARMRATREGTIKSQLSSIFRKSGVSTRTEFVAQFIDEFLDGTAEPL